VDLLGFSSNTAEGPLQIGDKVRLRPNVATPLYGWGFVSRSCVGVVHREYNYYEQTNKELNYKYF
jgi:hypothetical protein